MRYLIIFVCLLCIAYRTDASISGHISEADQLRLKAAIDKALITSSKEDLSIIYYASRAHTFLANTFPPIIVKTACGHLAKTQYAGLSAENTFYLVNSWKQLRCPGELPKQELIGKVRSFMNDKSTAADIYYGSECLWTLETPLGDKQKLAQMLQVNLKTDDSLLSFAYTFHVASKLDTAGSFAYERIEDIIVQADEIDGKLLQFEGGLGITSLLLSGIVKLSDSLGKTLPVTQVQVEKFANYLLSRRSVQSSKGICCLLEATKALIETKLSPACISVLHSGVVKQERPTLFVRVCDMLGRPLPLAASDAVVAQSATRLADDVVVLSKQKLVATKDPTLYELELKHDPGRYRIALIAGSHTASLSAIVLGTVKVEWLEIGVTDTDQISSGKLDRVPFLKKLERVLEADAQQRLVIKFSLGGRLVHQAFVRLECKQTGREIIFVSEVDSNGVYKFDMDVGSKATELGMRSGKYNVEVIVGDAIISNSFRWKLADIELRIGTAVQTGPAAASSPVRGLLPEIKHKFREPERRPPPFISTLFTGLVLVPLLILLALWFKLGINISNLKLSLSSLLFHGGLGGIFGLFVVFWLKLDMFTTCRWLLLFGLITFLAGHRLLSSLAIQRKH